MERKLTELPELFFATRQLIRQRLPKKNDPNEWTRFEILRFIATSAALPTMQDVAEFMRITAPSATSLVAHLLKKGLVRKVKGKTDKRSVCIEMTPKGKKLLENYIERSRETMRQVFSKLDDAEIHALVQILRKLQVAHKKA